MVLSASFEKEVAEKEERVCEYGLEPNGDDYKYRPADTTLLSGNSPALLWLHSGLPPLSFRGG